MNSPMRSRCFLTKVAAPVLWGLMRNYFFILLFLSSPIMADTDDTAALQDKINKTSARGVCILKSGSVWNVTRPVLIRKTINLRTDKEGVPATINCSNMADSWMALLVVEPTQGKPHIWKETLVSGQRPQLSGLIPEKHWVVGYGVNPHALHDPAENHYRGFSDAKGLPAAPRNIQGDTHWARELLTTCDGSTFQDINFTSAPGVNIDFAIGISRCRNIIIRNVTFDTRTAITVMDSRGVSIDGVYGKVNHVEPNQDSSGRIMTCWQSMDVSIRNVDMSISDAMAPFMAEAWCDGLSYDNITMRIRKERTTWPPAPLWFSNGGSRNQVVRSFEVIGDLYLTDRGGVPEGTYERPVFERGTFTGENIVPDIAVGELVKVGN